MNAERDEPSILGQASSTVSGLSRCNEQRLARAFDSSTAREVQGMYKPPGQKGRRHPKRRKRRRWRTRMGARPRLSSYLVGPCLCVLRYIISEIAFQWLRLSES